jgi:hypothetical protein
MKAPEEARKLAEALKGTVEKDPHFDNLYRISNHRTVEKELQITFLSRKESCQPEWEPGFEIGRGDSDEYDFSCGTHEEALLHVKRCIETL